MKKALKANLISSIAIFVVAVILLTGVTYAWFTSIANPDIQAFDLNVRAADALLLSAKSSPDMNYVADWKNTLLKTDITDPAIGNQTTAFPDTMLNVSSLFNATSSNFYTASHSSLGVLNGYALTTQPGNFVKFSLWVKSTRDGYVYLDTGSQVLPKPTDLAAPGASIAQTVRVGFVPLDSEGDEVWANSVIWEPNSNAHLTTTYGGPGGTSKLENNAVKGVLAADHEVVPTYDFIAGENNVGDDDEYDVAGGTNANKIALFDIKDAGTPGEDNMVRFNVYIWVEGTDLDTVNAVAKNIFTTYIKFGQMYDKFITP